MFSKPAEPRSIASQLVFRFTLAGALLLGAGLVLLYLIVVRHAFEEDNIFLADRISALRADLKNVTGPDALREQLRVPHGGKNMTYWIRAVDAGGRSVAETPGMNEIFPLNVFPEANSNGTITAPKDYRAHGKLFSLSATRETSNGRSYLIQVAQDRTVDEEFTREFGALLVVVLIIGVFLSAMIAATVTKRGLRPLAEMTGSFKRVAPLHLHERVPPRGWPRELQPLAAAFDDMLDRLEDSFTRLSQFSADIAHEIRTPVANIRGEAEVALTRPRTPVEYREVLESNVAECERLSGIIDNLLFLARAEAADRVIQRTSFDGRKEIEKVAAFYQPVAEEQQIAIACHGTGEVSADPLLFGRALGNLLENALRFTPAGGKIGVSIETGRDESKIIVSDTGCGIPPQHINKVFDRFYRVDSSRSSRGAGLGLALVKSIAELHGGSATITSTVNRGTIVTLIFPNTSGPAQKSVPV
jgi:two-component system, OmpR family, heavy metal sensor histidine kinase CusS